MPQLCSLSHFTLTSLLSGKKEERTHSSLLIVSSNPTRDGCDCVWVDVFGTERMSSLSPPWQQHFSNIILQNHCVIRRKRNFKKRENLRFSHFIPSLSEASAHCWTKWIRWCLSVIDLFEHFWNGEMVKPWRHARAVGGRLVPSVRTEQHREREERKTRENVENDEGGEWEMLNNDTKQKKKAETRQLCWKLTSAQKKNSQLVKSFHPMLACLNKYQTR